MNKLLSDELKPCPFCGGRADYVRNAFLPKPNRMVHCVSCGATIYSRKWNNRVDQPAPAPGAAVPDERDEFECRVYRIAEQEKYRHMQLLLKRDPLTDDYSTTWVDMMWKGWQARALLAAPPATPSPAVPALPPPELTWLFTHCRAIGMTKKSDSGKWEHDIALFTCDLQEEIASLRSQLATPETVQTELLHQYQFHGRGWITVNESEHREMIQRQRDNNAYEFRAMQLIPLAPAPSETTHQEPPMNKLLSKSVQKRQRCKSHRIN